MRSCHGRAPVVWVVADVTPAVLGDASVGPPRDVALGPRPERASGERQPRRLLFVPSGLLGYGDARIAKRGSERRGHAAESHRPIRRDGARVATGTL